MQNTLRGLGIDFCWALMDYLLDLIHNEYPKPQIPYCSASKVVGQPNRKNPPLFHKIDSKSSAC